MRIIYRYVHVYMYIRASKIIFLHSIACWPPRLVKTDIGFRSRPSMVYKLQCTAVSTQRKLFKRTLSYYIYSCTLSMQLPGT